MNPIESSASDYCGEIDTIIHRFVTRTSLKSFWSSFEGFWESQTGYKINLTPQDIIFGLYKDDNNYGLNCSILLAKHYIHKQKCKSSMINFKAFVAALKGHITIEKFICTKNNQDHILLNHWGNLIDVVYT